MITSTLETARCNMSSQLEMAVEATVALDTDGDLLSATSAAHKFELSGGLQRTKRHLAQLGRLAFQEKVRPAAPNSNPAPTFAPSHPDSQNLHHHYIH